MPQRGRRNANQALLIALACGATVEQAGQKAGVSPATVYRRLNDPEFCQQLREMQTDMVQRAAAMLTAAGMESVKTLLELQKPATSAAVRLGAAKAVLEMGMKVREVVNLEERLAALEQQLGVARPA